MKGHNYGECRKCGVFHIPTTRPGRTGWSKGLTKHTDLRIMRISEALKGRPKTEEHIRKISEAHQNKKHSQETKAKIGNAILKFNSKLSKEERSLKYGTFGDSNPSKREDVRERLRGPNPKKGHPGDKNCAKRPDVQDKIRRKAKERYSDPSWRNNFLISIRNNLFSVESFKHIRLKQGVKKYLESLGYIVEMERPVSVRGKSYIVDVFGYGKENIIVECGGCEKNKLRRLRSVFDVVVHVPYGLGVKEVERCLSVS